MDITNNLVDDEFSTWAPDGRLAFSSEIGTGGNKEIVTVPPTGGAVTRITFTPFAEFAIEWSPDGSRILYTSDVETEIFSVGSDGVGPVNISGNRAEDRGTSWSSIPPIPTGTPAGASQGSAVPGQASPTGSPVDGLGNCASKATVDSKGQIRLCDATNPPTAQTEQFLRGTLPASKSGKLRAAARKRRKPRILDLSRNTSTVPPGTTVPVRLKVGRKVRKALKAKATLKLQYVITATDTAGQTASISRNVTVKRAKKKKKRR